MNEAWEPSKWHREASPIAQVNGKRVFRYSHRFG